jgi:hypothetical protein
MRWGRGWDPIGWPLGARTALGRISQADQRRPAPEGSANEAHLLAWPASQEPPGSVAPMPPSHRSHRATGHYRRILAADAEELLKNLYRIAEGSQPGSTSRGRAALLPLSRLLATRDTLALAPGRRLWIRCGRAILGSAGTSQAPCCSWRTSRLSPFSAPEPSRCCMDCRQIRSVVGHLAATDIPSLAADAVVSIDASDFFADLTAAARQALRLLRPRTSAPGSLQAMRPRRCLTCVTCGLHCR